MTVAAFDARARRGLVASGIAALGAVACLLGGAGEVVRAAEIGPEADLCAAIDTLQPGDELVLQPGDYQGPCVIRSGGAPDAPVVIRGADRERRPRILYPGRSANVFEIRASSVRVVGLDFGPTAENVDAIRIFSGNDIAVEECRFSQISGIAVVANHSSVHGLTVRRNVILDSNATTMYFGCHDGASCVVSGLVVEGNYIRGVRAPDPQIGYGLEVKLNSTGIIRDNVIVDPKGPGIMVYGSRDPSRVSVVERNVVMGSRTSSGIVVGGGPAIVRNNVAVANREAGIGLENYRGRGLLRGVVVAHNTVYSNWLAGIEVPELGVRDAILVNNAVHARIGTSAFPARRAGLWVAGNVDCSWGSCFAGAAGLDFSPVVGSLLMGPGAIWEEAWMPRDDLFGGRRGMPPTVGAVEHPSGPITLGLKP